MLILSRNRTNTVSPHPKYKMKRTKANKTLLMTAKELKVCTASNKRLSLPEVLAQVRKSLKRN
jgi:hypothetical protein